MQNRSINQVFNLTFGSSRSILYLKTYFKKSLFLRNFFHSQRDRLMAIRGTLSIKKAKQLLNYRPKYSIDRGFAKYYLWYDKIYGKKITLKKKN